MRSCDPDRTVAPLPHRYLSRLFATARCDRSWGNLFEFIGSSSLADPGRKLVILGKKRTCKKQPDLKERLLHITGVQVQSREGKSSR